MAPVMADSSCNRRLQGVPLLASDSSLVTLSRIFHKCLWKRVFKKMCVPRVLDQLPVAGRFPRGQRCSYGEIRAVHGAYWPR